VQERISVRWISAAMVAVKKNLLPGERQQLADALISG